MSDAPPDPLIPPETPAVPDRRTVLTALLSVALHLALVGWLLLPRLPLSDAAEPPAINVDLVPPEVVSSPEPPPSSSAPMSSAEPPSSESPSSAEGVSSEPPSSEPISVEPASSAAASSAAASSAAASSVEPASSAAAAASAEPPAPRGRPVVIPVGPSEASSAAESSMADASSAEPSSTASEASAASDGEPSQLTASGSGGTDTVAEPSTDGGAAAPPEITGALHVAKRHYLEAILDAPAMAKARDAIEKLPPEKRLTQSCNIEAVGQLGNAGRGFDPDAVVADAFAKPVVDTGAASVTVTGGAFRSKQKWYGIAYTCALSRDLGTVKSFSYRIGDDVTAALTPRIGR